MKADGKTTVMTDRGTTRDIMICVFDTYERYRDDCAAFAERFRRETLTETARAIFDYVTASLRYVEDPLGKQFVKTPARLYAMKRGDCKSFTIFVNSMLWCLGWKPGFRFTSYQQGGDYTHVYTVVHDTDGSEMVIDTVAWLQKKLPFGTEAKYIKKYDMYTQIARMSGISGEGLDIINDKLADLQFDPDDAQKKINAYIQSSETKSLPLKNGDAIKSVKVKKDGTGVMNMLNGDQLNMTASFTKQMVDVVNSIPIREWAFRENPIYNQLNAYMLEQSRIRNAAATARYSALADMGKGSYTPVIIACVALAAIALLKGNNSNNHKHRRR